MVKKFYLKEKNNSYILEETDDKDRIEIAADFIADILK